MKKEYMKPYLAVELFQLNAAIAGSCSGENQIAIHQSIDTCKLGDQEGEIKDIYFGLACEGDVVNGSVDGVCYHSLTGAELFLDS